MALAASKRDPTTHCRETFDEERSTPSLLSLCVKLDQVVSRSQLGNMLDALQVLQDSGHL